jgi:hypothetical protein
MALSQHDLLRLMESLRTADGIELIRVVAQRILQELILRPCVDHALSNCEMWVTSGGVGVTLRGLASLSGGNRSDRGRRHS